MKIKVIVRKSKYCWVTVPHLSCKKLNIDIKDVLSVKISNITFIALVCGMHYNKRIHIPVNISRALRLEEKQKIELDIEKIRVRKKSDRLTIISKGNDRYIDLLPTAPNKMKRTGYRIVVLNKNDEILLWTKGNSYDITLPRYLLLDDYTIRIMGLYQGEGYKKLPIGGARVEFANCEPYVIQYFLKFFEERLNIPRNKWSAYVTFRGNPSIEQLEKMKEFWSKISKIPIDNFQKSRTEPLKGVRRRAKNGTLHVLICSSILGEILVDLLNKLIQEIILKDRNFADKFLQGVLAAEGSANVLKWKNITTLHTVEIAAGNYGESELYKKILELLDIRHKDNFGINRKIAISGWKNFCKLAELEPFKYHPTRNKKFINGFLNHQYTIWSSRFLKILLNDPLTLEEISKELKSTKFNTRMALNTWVKRGLLRKNIENNTYSIREIGKKIFKTINSVNEARTYSGQPDMVVRSQNLSH